MSCQQQKNKKSTLVGVLFVVLPGFEPRQADPESDVLPLHHRTIGILSFESGCKSTNFFLTGKKKLFEKQKEKSENLIINDL